MLHASCRMPHASCLMPHASCLMPHAACLMPHAAPRLFRANLPCDVMQHGGSGFSSRRPTLGTAARAAGAHPVKHPMEVVTEHALGRQHATRDKLSRTPAPGFSRSAARFYGDGKGERPSRGVERYMTTGQREISIVTPLGAFSPSSSRPNTPFVCGKSAVIRVRRSNSSRGAPRAIAPVRRALRASRSPRGTSSFLCFRGRFKPRG
jgi:hypothetical protein